MLTLVLALSSLATRTISNNIIHVYNILKLVRNRNRITNTPYILDNWYLPVSLFEEYIGPFSTNQLEQSNLVQTSKFKAQTITKVQSNNFIQVKSINQQTFSPNQFNKSINLNKSKPKKSKIAYISIKTSKGLLELGEPAGVVYMVGRRHNLESILSVQGKELEFIRTHLTQ